MAVAFDPDSPEARRELEAKELRLWVEAGETGLWCPSCALPSGFTIVVRRDPAEQPTTWIWRCAEDADHRQEGDVT